MRVSVKVFEVLFKFHSALLTKLAYNYLAESLSQSILLENGVLYHIRYHKVERGFFYHIQNEMAIFFNFEILKISFANMYRIPHKFDRKNLAISFFIL